MAKNRIVFSDDFILKDQRIGIGTADPKESLDVVGNATISQNLYIGNSIGIGTTSPKSDFDVNGTLRVSGVSTFSNDVNIFSSLNGNPIGKFNDGGSVELYNDGSKKFETTGVGVSIFNGTSDTATIQGPANLIIDPMPVGVGTTSGVVRIKGDLYVDGTETIINSTTIELADFIVGIASTATSDILADGAGIKIGPDNTFLYEYNGGTDPSLKSSENLNVASGKAYQIDQTEVLSATTLGTGVTNSSLKTLGTLAQSLDLESGNTYKINNTDVLSSTTLGSGVTASSLTSLGTLIEDLDIESGKVYKINNTEVLSSTTLGSGVTASSLTGLGTLAQSLDLESGNTYKIDNTEVLSSTTLGSGVTQSSLTGVGTLTTLSVSGDVSVADKIVHTGDTDTAIRFPSENTFAIETGGQERIRVTGVGSFGIGTTDPTTSLDINGSIRIRGVFYDELNHPGGAGQVLSATGTGVTWTGFSEISVGNADTLDNLDSTDFLRSNVDDTKTGITTFEGLVDIDANVDIQETLTVGQGVTVTGISTFNDNVDINANVDIQETLTVGQGVTVTGISTFASNVDINANVDIQDSLVVGGGLTVTGVSTFASNLDINANVDIQETLTVGQGVTVTGISTFNSNVDINANVDIQETLTVGQGVTVTGISTFNSNVDINANVDIQDSLVVGGGLTVTGVSTFASNVDINANVDIQDSLVVGGGLTVTGISTFNSNVDIDANVDIQDSLVVGQGVTVTGISTFNSNVDINANVDIRDTLTVGQGVTVTGISTFNDNVDINANVDIRDTLTVGQGVTVTGISTFNSNVDIDANVDIQDSLVVGGGLTVTGVSTFASNVDINANVDIRDTLTVGQGVTVTGISTFNSNVDIRDNLIVSGVSTISIADTTSYDPANGPVSPTGSDVLTLINTDQTTDGYTGIYFQHKTNNVAWGRMALQGNFFGSPQHAFVFTMRGGSGLSNNEKFRIGNTGTISFKGDTDTYITGDGSDSIQIYTNSLERVGIDSLGKVGIGTDSPTQLLDVNGDLRLRGGLYDSGINTTGTSAQSLVSTGAGVSWKDSNTIASGQEIFAPASGTPYYITATNVTSGIASAAFNDSTIVIKDSNVGIGTTIPTQTLDVNGTATVRDSLSIGTTTPTAKLTIDVGTGTTAIDVQGSAGQLFSVTNNLTSGSIFSVNDVSGIPSIDVDADGTIQLAPFGSTENVGVGITNPSQKLDVNGGIRLRGALYDFGGNAGGINQSLVSTGTGVTWSTMTLAAAGQQIYEEEASTAYYLVGTKITPSLTGIGTAGFASDTVVLKDSKIGIGTDSPTEKLDVGGNIKILSNGNGASASSYELLFYGTTSGSVQRKHAKIQSSPWADNTNGGELKFFTNTSGNVITERMRIDGEGNVGIGTDNPQYKLQVLGDFAATTKSFVIPHPTKPGMTLRHGNLEGPENAVYVRGKTTESIIKLPDYWTGLVDEETITVNLTPKNDYLHRVVNVSDNQVEIKAVDGEIDCYFMILGERKDVAKLEVEF